MLYGDLGRYPLSVTIKKRIVGFWYDLINNVNKISSSIIKLIMQISITNISIKWLKCAKTIFDSCSLSYIWNSQYFVGSKSMLVNEIDIILKLQLIQTCQADLTSIPKCLYVRLYKFEHKFEEFFSILDGKLLQSFINFRMCNNHLLIEKGHWQDMPRHHRVCNICNSNKLADEFHYLFKCGYFGDNRSIVINKSLYM